MTATSYNLSPNGGASCGSSGIGIQNGDFNRFEVSFREGQSRLVMCFINRFALHDCCARRQTAGSAALLADRHSTSGFNSWFVLHASILQHVGPLSTRSSMAMLQVLAEMVSSVKLFRLIALVKLVHIRQMLNPTVPILLWKIGEFFSAKPAGVVGRTTCVV